MSVPLLDLTRQHDSMVGPLCDQFAQVLKSGQFVLGPYADNFERQLAEYCGVRHAVVVSSGTDALLVALMALSIQPGDEVITSAFTFFATAGCIMRLGGKPVFVDIDPDTFNLDVQKIDAAVTASTKAIIPVHLYGQMADMEPIQRVAQRHGLKVIEDAAQALGAMDRDRPAGSIGHIGCMSFYPSKNLAALGDGGACLLNDGDLAQRIRILREHGQDSAFTYEVVGGNFRLDAVQAMVLSVKLPHVEEWIEQRRANAQRYQPLLEGLPVNLPREAPQKRHTYNQYTIRVDVGQRDALRDHLSRSSIGTQIYYRIPLHLQPCLKHLGYARGELPNCERAADSVLSLPIYPELSSAQQEEVAKCVREFFRD